MKLEKRKDTTPSPWPSEFPESLEVTEILDLLKNRFFGSELELIGYILGKCFCSLSFYSKIYSCPIIVQYMVVLE